MQSKSIQSLFMTILFFCVVGLALFIALIPRFFGNLYTIKMGDYKMIELPFGSFISLIPQTTGEGKDPNTLPCEEVFAPLIWGGEGHILDENFSCTPPKNSPYLKGIKTPYGISLKIKDTYFPSYKIEELKEAPTLMANVWIHDGVGSVEEIILGNAPFNEGLSFIVP